MDSHLEAYQAIALDIHDTPETSNHEHFACGLLATKLQEEGFEVKVDVAGHPTGFDARYQSKARPTLVFLAEYDALEGLGHGCGHNLFGATSILAGIALKQILDETGGEIRVYGTPGEEGGENGSAKGSFVREGFFKDADAALCVHPSDQHGLTTPTLANDPVDIEFFGKASHAASATEEGINALEAMILAFNGINALRQHLPSDVRINGIITHGGTAANIIPDYTKARFYLRAATRQKLDKISRKVENIVKGAALQTGTTYTFGLFQNRVDNVIPTSLFDEVYRNHLEAFNEKAVLRISLGSTDVGNVSQVIPVIHPHIKISDQLMAGHSLEFKAAACSPQGLASIGLG
ncbi:MAG: M20 family peptidase, partial [Erysipelotrichales bacterium]